MHGAGARTLHADRPSLPHAVTDFDLPGAVGGRNTQSLITGHLPHCVVGEEGEVVVELAGVRLVRELRDEPPDFKFGYDGIVAHRSCDATSPMKRSHVSFHEVSGSIESGMTSSTAPASR